MKTMHSQERLPCMTSSALLYTNKRYVTDYPILEQSPGLTTNAGAMGRFQFRRGMQLLFLAYPDIPGYSAPYNIHYAI